MAVGLSAAALAEAASLKTMAVESLERGEKVPDMVHRRLQQALEAAGVEILAERGEGAGVRLRKPYP